MQADSWVEKNKPNDEELRRFRAEAEVVLRINHKDTKATKQNRIPRFRTSVCDRGRPR